MGAGGGAEKAAPEARLGDAPPVGVSAGVVGATTGSWRQGELTAGAPRRCTNSSPSARTTIRTANPARYRTKTIGRDQPITGSTRCAGHIRKRCMRSKSPPVLWRGGAMVSPQNGRGATIFAKICASAAPGRTCSAAPRRRALALQLAGAARVFLGEIKVDRHRFAQHEPVIVDRRDVAVWVDLEKIGCATAALRVDRDVLVFEPQLLRHP